MGERERERGREREGKRDRQTDRQREGGGGMEVEREGGRERDRERERRGREGGRQRERNEGGREDVRHRECTNTCIYKHLIGNSTPTSPPLFPSGNADISESTSATVSTLSEFWSSLGALESRVTRLPAIIEAVCSVTIIYISITYNIPCL